MANYKANETPAALTAIDIWHLTEKNLIRVTVNRSPMSGEKFFDKSVERFIQQKMELVLTVQKSVGQIEPTKFIG